MSINIKETKYKDFVVAKPLEDAMIPWLYREAPPHFDTKEEAEAALTPDTTVFEFDCTLHEVTPNV